MAVLVTATVAAAQTCTEESLAAAVDKAGANLRALTSESAPKVQARIRQLANKRGWTAADAEEKAYTLLADDRLDGFDRQTSDLVQKIDQLGVVASAGKPDCAKLPDLDATSIELQATIRARTAYVLQKLDRLAGESGTTAAAAPPAPAQVGPLAQAARPPVVAAPAQPKATGPWTTSTAQDAPPPAAAPKAQPPTAAAPAEPAPPRDAATPPPDDDGYTIAEIIAASEGVFGKVTANLGSVIEYAFRKSGRPAGYIIGTEGGGAIVAGVRYGQGTLYMRSGGTTRVYWHGPSLGFDFGASGSRSMFLIYKLARPDDLFSSYTGIDGSAYVVGGLGLTFMTNGQVQLAPIRSGLGLRIGANVGYVRFTRQATWNPF